MLWAGLSSRGLRWCAVSGFAALVQIHGAVAEDVPAPGTPGRPHTAIDSTLDLNTFGGSFDVNVLTPLGGDLNESGFRARFTGSTSWYKFPAGEPSGQLSSGQSYESNILAGYGWALPRLNILLVGGSATILSNDAGTSRTRNGGKAVLSIYATPTDQTMLYSRFQYSTLSDALELQTKGGIKILNFAYLGPEAKYASRTGSNECRIGPHLSGINVGPVALSLAGGWLWNSALGAGKYFSTSIYVAF